MPVINRMTKYSLLLTLVLALAAPLAHANPGNGRFHPREANRQDARQRQQPPPQQQPNFQREEPQRFQRRDEGNAGEQQRQRLSPEERRQLRRDIHDAGRDIYRR